MIKKLSAAALCCLPLLLAGCRSNDSYEPNDTIETATAVMQGIEVLATVGQDNPDVFSIQAPAGKTVVFSLTGKGREECPEFAVTGPDGKTLYQDQRGFCGDPPLLAESNDGGVAVSGKAGKGYELRVPAKAAGMYYLTVKERKQPDNTFPYSWDYALTAKVE